MTTARLGWGTATGDPNLATSIDAWPTLPEAIRQQILGLVRAAGGGDRGNG